MDIIGFTGTRSGLTPEQKAYLYEELERSEASDFVHGDCIGADIQAAKMAQELDYRIYTRPCDIDKYRAWFKGVHVLYPVKPALERNKDIVDQADLMIACPSGFKELFRGSGTWHAIRYAKSKHKPVLIIWPDGTVGNAF